MVNRTSQTLSNWEHEGLLETIMIGNQKFYKKTDLIKASEDKKAYHNRDVH